jgi:glutamine phosphoribosylpyrophosphate amidotransferase
MHTTPDEKCCFNYLYRFDNDLIINNNSVKSIKQGLIEKASEEIKKLLNNYDFIAGVPDTGLYYAKKISKIINLPYVVVYDKRVSKRTLGDNIVERVTFYRQNLRFVGSALSGKRVLFIDEAVFSGTTYFAIKESCKLHNIKPSFFVLSPINRLHCPWGHIVCNSRLFANSSIHPKEIIHMQKKNFMDIFPPDKYCSLCFTG